MRTPHPGDTSGAARQARIALAAAQRLQDIFASPTPPTQETFSVIEEAITEARAASDRASGYLAAANTATYTDGVATQVGLAFAALARENAEIAKTATEEVVRIANMIDDLRTR